MVRAFLVGQTVEQSGHINPALSICFASTWFLTTEHLLELKGHWRQCQIPISSLCMFLVIKSSRPEHQEKKHKSNIVGFISSS
jgi:hypothetical protein